MFTSEDLIEIAAQIDRNAEEIYRRALSRAKTPKLRSMLEWMVEEEARHVKWFAVLKEKIEHVEGDQRIAEVGREILLETIGSLSFSLEDANVSEVQKEMELIKITVEFERDKAQFFEMLRPFVEDSEAKDHLEKIIAEERKHARQLHLCAAKEPHRY